MSQSKATGSTLPMRFVAPGLLWLLTLELCILSGLLPHSLWTEGLLTASMLLLPWAGLTLAGLPPQVIGYTRQSFGLHFGWGLVAGGVWRLASLTLNLWALRLSGVLTGAAQIFSVLIWVPFVEETFFRGYIGHTLCHRWGPARGILIQALMFTLLPAHVSQGVWHLISIFSFAVLTGWLMNRLNSLWAPWGAHAFANLLPLLLNTQY